jgi:hypothetical protein
MKMRWIRSGVEVAVVGIGVDLEVRDRARPPM